MGLSDHDERDLHGRPVKKAHMPSASLEVSLRSDAIRAYNASNEETREALNRRIGSSRVPQAGGYDGRAQSLVILSRSERIRSDVLPKYASARRCFARLASGTFLTGLWAEAFRGSRRLRNSVLKSSGERGVVLVAVLWTFVFLFVVALEFTAAVREEGSAAARFAQETEGYYLALAAFHQGLYDTLDSFSQPGAAGASRVALLFDEGCREGTLAEGLYRFCLEDEGGKISLNGADELTLRQVFSHLDIEPARRDVLVDSILDWRDADDLHRTSGAESDYYLSLPTPYKAKNAPFDTVEELLWVRGMTMELFYGDGGSAGVRKILTVDNPANRLNLRTASAEAIRVFLGLTIEQAGRFVEERDKLSEKTLADVIQLLGLSAEESMARRLAFTIPQIITIEASGYVSPSGPVRKLKGVVRLGSRGSGFQLLRWVDREM